MHKMIRLVQKAKKAKGGVEYYTAGTTRLLSFFAHWRFLYFHGQRHARLLCDQTVYHGPKRERTALISMLSPLLFFAPDVHLDEMEKLWTDEVIIETAWKSFINKLLNEWNSLIIGSTVMLAVNVGFLAIPGVVPYNVTNGVLMITRQVILLASLSEIASAISLDASIGSIVIGLLLMRHNRTMQDSEPSEASRYLYQNSQRYFGLELMAIVFSLPWVLLMWSMVMFFVAVFFYCFSISDLRSRISSALISVVALAFIVGCISTVWESRDEGGVLQNGFHAFRARALQPLRTFHRGTVARLRYFKGSVVRSFRNCFHSDDVESVHSLALAGPGDGIGRV